MTRRGSTVLSLLPAALVIGVFMLVPLGYAVVYSFLTAGTYGGVEGPFSVAAYVQFVFQRDWDDSLTFDPLYLRIFLRSIGLAGATTVLCALLALPLAWYVATRPKALRMRLIFLITLPFWVNSLIRTYCWVLLLRDQGLINQGLQGLGLTEAPLGLMYNNGAILLGLVYNFLPFMVLPVYAALERIDPRVIDAGFDLYARRWQVFTRIILPLALPGLRGGALMVLAPAIGYYIIPDLLGGGQHLMIGNLIQIQFTSGRNWPFGAALSTLLTAAILLLLWAGAARRGGRR
ncbi:MAG: ABC transporter permease [Rhodobacteraceae bacterium]|nr:ABC transporter permease [Paracoccaceae bacterium]